MQTGLQGQYVSCQTQHLCLNSEENMLSQSKEHLCSNEVARVPVLSLLTQKQMSIIRHKKKPRVDHICKRGSACRTGNYKLSLAVIQIIYSSKLMWQVS